MRPMLDLMQTLPTFVYLIPTLVLFGLGMVPGLISTVIFAIPAPIRLTHLGISSVPKQLKEAGEAFGATPAPAPVEGRAALRAADDHGRAHPVHHAVAVDGGDRGAGRRRRARRAGGAGAQHGQHRAWASRPGSPSCVLAILLDRVCKRPERGVKASSEMRGSRVRQGRHRLRRRAAAAALPLIDQGASRDEIIAATGQVLGAIGDQPRRRARRDLRADGPVGLGQVDAAARRQRAQHGRPRQVAGRARGREGRRRDLRRRRRSATSATQRGRHGVPAVRAAALAHGRARMSASASSCAAWPHGRAASQSSTRSWRWSA